MNVTPDFLKRAFLAAIDGLGSLAGLAGLHLRPALLPRGKAQRFRRHLAILERYVRRLVLLWALQFLQKPMPPVPSVSIQPVSKHSPDSLRANAAPYFAILPPPLALGLSAEQADFPDIKRRTGAVPTAPIYKRIAALENIFRTAEKRARLLAKRLSKEISAGAPRPFVASDRPLPQLGLELSTFITMVPHTLRQALSVWDNSS